MYDLGEWKHFLENTLNVQKFKGVILQTERYIVK